MINASEFYGPRRLKARNNNTLLKGNMIPRRFKSIVIRVTGVRSAPSDWDCRLILDFDFHPEALEALRGSEAASAHSWAVNKTNGQRLRSYLSASDDFEELVDCRVRLKVIPQRDPKSGERVRSLEVTSLAREGSTHWEVLASSGRDCGRRRF
jgi:hypothetical protein